MKWLSQHLATVLLWTSSIILVGFVGFWIQREYLIEKKEMEQDLSRALMASAGKVREKMFREFVITRFDSLDMLDEKMLKDIESMSSDSVDLGEISVKLRTRSNSNMFIPKVDSSDLSNYSIRIFTDSPSQVKVARTNRSTWMSRDTVGRAQFISRLTAAYHEQLELLGYQDLSFVIESMDEDYREQYSAALISQPIRDRMYRGHFVARVDEYGATLWNKISNNVFIGLVFLLVVWISLYFIYRSWKKQKELTSIKNDLISNIAHELKTPITTVKVALEAISHFNVIQDREKTMEYIDISNVELDRLSILVDKVINTAIFERQQLEYKPEVFNIELLVHDIIRTMKVQFEKHKAQVQFKSSSENLKVHGDKIHLTNMIINLIDNAIKYSPANPQIEIDLSMQNEQIRMQIKDQGIGMEKEHLNKIFDKFYRVPEGNLHNTKGHGLGLSYVSQVVELHQGKIEVMSQLDQGTSFTILLPAA